MSKFLHHYNTKALAIPRVFSENSRGNKNKTAENGGQACFNLLPHNSNLHNPKREFLKARGKRRKC